ncbi:MAG: ammonium transporter [Flavobacteriaceae bacterium]
MVGAYLRRLALAGICLGSFAAEGYAAAPDAASLEARIAALEGASANIDYVWTLVAAALVLMMQVGFLLLEAGMVRSKNAINVAQKNLLDFVVSVVIFGAVGFMIAFGVSGGMPVGSDSRTFFLSDLSQWELVFFVFQVMFCGTAATIVSGAVAERMKLTAYILCSIVTAGLIYPVFVHWAWGAGLNDNASAFLSHMGFVDFAGSTVVHATGAWISLAACIVLGARRGRFDANGRPVRIHGHSPVLATAGALLLFVGWIGFNGGSTMAGNTGTAHIIANTVIAAGTGSAAAYIISMIQDGGQVSPDKTISGMLGGLVAITAGCYVLQPHGAMMIGILGGSAAVWANIWLERRLKIDDAVGAIGVHGAAGVVGTLGLVFFAPLENLPLDSRYDQFLVQLTGIGINFAWSFGLALIFFLALNRVYCLRVDAGSEDAGLNFAEHGSRLGIGHVEDALTNLVSGNADLNMRLPVAPGDEAERLTYLFNSLMDNIQAEEYSKVTEADARRSAEEAERLAALANATFEAIVISVNGHIVDGNHALEQLIGAPLSELKGRPLTGIFIPDDQSNLRHHFANPESPLLETFAIDRGGNAIPVEVRGREILYRGIRTRVSAISDLRERRMAEERIRHLAHHDPLTDLPNRAVFQDRLSDAIARAQRQQNKMALLLVDLDRFKDINDLHGHPAGDEVIRVTARRLKAIARSIDTVARLGGDEFAIIQRDIQFDSQAADLAHRLVLALSQPIEAAPGISLRCGGSIGIAISPDHALSMDELVTKADTALYRAKKNGRNAYFVFEKGMDIALKRRRMLDADLELALETSQFELWYQPQVSLSEAAITGFEALLRWRHPEKGLISPDDFISLAEESGKIVRIGEWALREACRTAAQTPWLRRVSVNVSPVQFRDKGFVQSVKDVLAETGLDPQRLEIEITESVLIHDDDVRALQMLHELKRQGIRIALDDFGTGYSSLSYLSRFPFDQIKIDRSFVRALSESEGAQAIIQTIIRLGKAFSMQIVAEGAENENDIRFLAGEGCDVIQGYYFSRPAPLEDFTGDGMLNIPAKLEFLNGPAPLVEKLEHMALRMRSVADPVSPAEPEKPAFVRHVN